MAAAPRRLERRRDHLAAHIVPVERALLHRANELQQEITDYYAASETGEPTTAVLVAGQVATEFRLLAEELHWQP